MEVDSVPVSNEIIVMPGDVVPSAVELGKTKKVVLGPGLRRLNEEVVACKAGVLKQNNNIFWVDNYQKRYLPVRGETVIGIVVGKSGDIFRVDIGTHEAANLSYLGFEGATKKNRPDVNIGDIVFAKLIVANKDLESELICVDSMGKKGKLGVLSDGLMFSCSINLVRKIAKEKCPLIAGMQKEMPFEIAIGMNGRVWIKTKTIKETIALGHAIFQAEKANDEEINKICVNIGNKLFS